MKNFGVIVFIAIIVILSVWFSYTIAVSDLPFWVKFLLLK